MRLRRFRLKRHSRGRRKNYKALRIFLVVLLITGVLIILLDMRIRPIIKRSGTYQSKVAATRQISETLYEIIQSREYNYDTFCEIVMDQDEDGGNIAYIEVDALSVSAFKSLVTKELEKKLHTMSSEGYGINIGNLTGSEIFYGRGAKIPIKIIPKGNVHTSLVSEFASQMVSINQTKHSIWLEINAEVTAFIPGYSEVVQINDRILIAENVIVGRIPDAYTFIDNLGTQGGNDDLIGTINDFGAGNYP